ncbi:hypothetical protein [Leptospira interrogans]|nr:hypothetical protein [Leptospira interrogans]
MPFKSAENANPFLYSLSSCEAQELVDRAAFGERSLCILKFYCIQHC